MEKQNRAVLVLFSAVLLFCTESAYASVQDVLSGLSGSSSITETAVFIMHAASEITEESPGTLSAASGRSFQLLYAAAAEGDDKQSRPFLGVFHLHDAQFPAAYRESLFSAFEASDARTKRDVQNSLEHLFGRKPDFIYIDESGAAEKLLTVVQTLTGTGNTCDSETELSDPELWEAFMKQAAYFSDEQIFSRMAYIFSDDVPAARIRSAFAYLAELYGKGIEPLHIPVELDQEGILLYEGSMMRMKLDQLRFRLNQ